MVIAHAGPATPDTVWTTWSTEPLVMVGLAAYVLVNGYGLAAGRARPVIAPMVRRRALSAGAASVVLALALLSPIDAAAEVLFSAHMVQHLLLSAVAAPLLVLSDPMATLRRLLSPRWRSAATRMARWTSATSQRHRGAPVGVATLLAVTTMSIWHAPVLYDAALRSDVVHAIEHASLLLVSVLFWSTVIRAARRSQTLASITGLAVTSAHGAALGALLALAPRPWYGGHAAAAGGWNIDALADQQVAGAIMWVPAGAVYLGAMAIILHGALSDRAPVSSSGTSNRRTAVVDTPT